MANLFFDFDGVLVQSRYSDRTFLWQKDIELDLEVPKAVLNELFRQPSWSEIISGKSDFTGRIEEVFQQNGVCLAADEFVSYWLSHDMNWRYDVLALASKLKEAGHSLYIATNQDRIRSTYISKQKDILRIFNGIFSSCDLGITKPNPQFYQRIQNQNLPESGGDVFVIDDDKRNVEAANGVGWKGFHFDPDLDETHSVAGLEKALLTAIQ